MPVAWRRKDTFFPMQPSCHHHLPSSCPSFYPSSSYSPCPHHAFFLLPYLPNFPPFPSLPCLYSLGLLGWAHFLFIFVVTDILFYLIFGKDWGHLIGDGLGLLCLFGIWFVVPLCLFVYMHFAVRWFVICIFIPTFNYLPPHLCLYHSLPCMPYLSCICVPVFCSGSGCLEGS